MLAAVLAEVASFAAAELALARTGTVWVQCLGVQAGQGGMEEPVGLA